MNLTLIVITVFIFLILVLVLTVLYLLYNYRKLLDREYEASIREGKDELKAKVKFDADKFVREKTDEALGLAVHEASEAISKNAESIARSIRKKTIEELSKEEKADEAAVSAEFDQAKKEIEEFKAHEMGEIKRKAGEVLVKTMPSILAKSLDREAQEKLIVEELANAKRSNIF